MREEGSNQSGQQIRDESARAEGHSAGHQRDEHVEHLIGELKQRSSELERANRELRRVSHYRSLFLARMSHELRTPLTSILGFAEIMLEQETLTEAQRRYCQKIQDSGQQLQASLDQLVDLSRVEAGQTELFLQEFSLRETMRDSCAALTRHAQKHQVKIEYEIAPDITTIVSDQGRLRQILYSFLAWCLSRSKSGQEISIQAMIVEPSRLQIRFEDEGPRIEDPARIFEPNDTGSGEFPNLDELGIIIGRRLLDIMSGTVELENRGPAGVRVKIELPARP
jgi:signal transduction histidine kinase